MLGIAGQTVQDEWQASEELELGQISKALQTGTTKLSSNIAFEDFADVDS